MKTTKNVLFLALALFAIASASADIDCSEALKNTDCAELKGKSDSAYKACCNPLGNQLAEPTCTQESTRAGLKVFGPEITGYDDQGNPIYKTSGSAN